MRIPDNQNPSICGPCGGKCCKKQPGIYHPDDFGETEEEVKSAVIAGLDRGDLTIDWWEGDPTGEDDDVSRGYFVRPASKDEEPSTRFRGLWHGECSRLGPDGCELDWADRPAQCRALLPRENNKCHLASALFEKQPLAVAWKPHWGWIRELEDVDPNAPHLIDGLLGLLEMVRAHRSGVKPSGASREK